MASSIYNTMMIIYPPLPLEHPVLQVFVLQGVGLHELLLQAICTPPIYWLRYKPQV